MTAIDRFARFAVTLAPPAETLTAAELVTLDWFGAAIAGSAEMPASALRRILPDQGSARLVPHGTSDPRTAALINGTASHIVEVDDIYRSGLYHPGVVTIPAALAVADAHNISGIQFLCAVIAGYEVSNRIARAVNPAHYRYWHTTATVGHFGASVAASVALGLTAKQTAHAMASAATFAAGLRQAFTSDAMSKPLHAGRAAEAGVLAALAAQEGVTGVSEMLDGPRGFGVAMSGDVDWERATESLGDEWTINATTPKAHACCGHSFAALDAIRELMTRHAVKADQISAIRVRTYKAALEICGNANTISAAEGRFSLPWCASAMVHLGGVTPAAFTPDALSDRDMRALASRVILELDPEAEARFPDARSATVAIELTDGRSFSHHRPTRKGDPDDPMTSAEIARKFMELAAPVIGAGPADALRNECVKIRGLTSLRDLPFTRVDA